jgi:hypothetical protein
MVIYEKTEHKILEFNVQAMNFQCLLLSKEYITMEVLDARIMLIGLRQHRVH